MRTELEGQRPETIGARTYLTPFRRSVECSLSWQAARRVLAVSDDGAAEVEETLELFRAPGTAGSLDEESEKLWQALVSALGEWGVARTLQFRETPAGVLLFRLGFRGAPALDEAAPQLLTPWLLRALRPTAALPTRPVRFGERWQEPRAVQLRGWTDARGQESGEWLQAPQAGEPAVRLLVQQQIFGSPGAGGERPPGAKEAAASGEGRFHAESLATLSLADGRLLAASRSASRETTWVVPAEGLPEPARFRARLSVEIQIEECGETCL